MRSPITSNRSRLLAGALLIAPLALVACGGDDDADTSATAAETPISAPAAGDDPVAGSAPVATIVDETDEADGGGGRDEWISVGADYLDGGDREFDECLSEGVVDGIGYENLEASGTTPEEFWSASDITQFGIEIGDMDGVAGDLTECGDLVDYFAEVAGGTDAQVVCMREFFDDEDVAEVIVTSMLGAEPSEDLLAKQTDMRACAEEPAGD